MSDKLLKRLAFIIVCVLLPAVSCREKSHPLNEGLKLKMTETSYESASQFITVTDAGSWELSLSDNTLTNGQSDINWIGFKEKISSTDRLPVLSGSGNRNVLLVWERSDNESARSCEIVLTTENGQYSVVFTQQPRYSSSVNVASWLELPRVDNEPNQRFVTHDMTVGIRHCRNYSYLLDTDAKVSLWVAYPLNKSLIGSGDRHFSGTTYWKNTIDPKVPRELQAVTEYPFRGYQRGHQIPSADRLTEEANFETFYGTNMTPQLGNLNGQAWARLESKVRVWANAFDTLYVVSGADIKGSSKKVQDNDGKAVTVPVGYFKALLGYKKSGTIADTGANGGYTAIAFYFDHTPYDNNDSVIMSLKMSVDELEKKLGYDFFPNLTSKTSSADAIEAKVNNWWK